MKNFKKFLATLICIVTMLSALFAAPAGAANEIKVFLENEEISFDVPPQIINGRTMVPLRAIFEALDASVEWEQSTQTIKAHREDKQEFATYSYDVVMQIGNNEMTVNGEKKSLDTPPVIVGDRTLVPVRAVAESLGVGVLWDDKRRIVALAKKIEEKNFIFTDYEYNMFNEGTFSEGIGKTDWSFSFPLNWEVKSNLIGYRNVEPSNYDEEFVYIHNINFTNSEYPDVKGWFGCHYAEVFDRPKTFDEFVAQKTKDTNDISFGSLISDEAKKYESIYFDYHVDGNYEYYINLYRYSESYTALDDNKVNTANIRGEAICKNVNDERDSARIYILDEKGTASVEEIKNILLSLNPAK